MFPNEFRVSVRVQEVLDSLPNAVVMPAGQISNPPAPRGDFLQGRNEEERMPDELQGEKIRLSFTVSRKNPKMNRM